MKISKVVLSFLLAFSFYSAQANGFGVEPKTKIPNTIEPLKVELQPFNPIMQYHRDSYIQLEDPKVLKKAAEERPLSSKILSIITYPFRFIYLISSSLYAKITLIISGLA